MTNKNKAAKTAKVSTPSHAASEIKWSPPERYRGICTCGKFATKVFHSSEKAQASLEDHIESKIGEGPF